MNKQENLADINFNLFREYVTEQLKEFDNAGVGISFVSKNEQLFVEGLGYRDLEKKLPFTAETIFPIASHTKTFTTTGLAMLVDEGLISLEEPIKKFLPEIKLSDSYITEKITLRDLLSHTTGYPHHQFLFMNSNWSYKDVLNRLPYLDFAYEFRSRHKYSNLNFMIATKLIEELTGTDYFEFIKKRIFSPLGMKQTNFSYEAVKGSENITKGYTKTPEGLKEEAYIELKNISAGAGSINSTLKDMSKWIQFLINKGKIKDKELLSDKTFHAIRQLQKLDSNPFDMIIPDRKYVHNYGYAIGWWSLIYRGLQMFQHYGTGPGIIFNGGFIPEAEVGYVLFSNTSGSDLPFVLNFHLADLVQGIEPIDWCKKIQEFEEKQAALAKEKPKASPEKELPIKGTKPSRKLNEYVGIYSHLGYGELEFFIEKDQLGTLYGKDSKLTTEHYHFDTFTIYVTTLGKFAVPKFVTFRDNFEGEITHLEINAEPLVKPAIFKKVKQ